MLIAEILEFVEENDVKFVRLAFCDLFGNLKNMAIMSNRLKEAFEKGISFDASKISGFTNANKSDLLLFPDPNTMSVLPWRPQQGKVLRFLCDIKNPDGTPFSCDTRNILKNAIKKLAEAGFDAKIGLECDFYYFKTDASGEPTLTPQDEGTYLDMAPADKGENVRRETCLSLEEVGIRPLSSHHEQGGGQNNIDLAYNNPLFSADGFLTFKTVAKAIASRNGLYVSFMPRPLPDSDGSGLHVNMSLYKEGKNLFSASDKDGTAKFFISGILNRISEMTAFLNPILNSYERLGRDRAPIFITWSQQNRFQLIRIPHAAGGEAARMELRSPDPCLNPYIAFALLLNAGLLGIQNKEALPPAVNATLYPSENVNLKLKKLPETLADAIQSAEASELAASVLGTDALKSYLDIKKQEIAEADASGDAATYCRKKYFKVQ